ncbi:ATP-binding protein [Kitasatospora sp. NPDC005856]|uniref:ATP-binding protein n=1 Tax=Kitasatospora sp. NPDC005856 TaxID=3154566 RepID=UPI0033C9949D
MIAGGVEAPGPARLPEKGGWWSRRGSRGREDRTWDKRMRELVGLDVLALDDFAMRRLTAAQAGDLYELVSERRGRSLIITSSRAPGDWYPLFANPVVAGSSLERLISTSHQVVMNGPGCRPNKRPRGSATKDEKVLIR